ncbi:MAG: DNA polymerase [Nitrosotalea sp.]
MAEHLPITKYRTLKNLRKRKQYRRLGETEYRTIRALDTEATPEGKALLIADDKGNRLDLEDLTGENILKFLFSKRYETSWNFFWNISYDTRIILRLLGENILRQPQRKSRLIFKAFGFTISIIEKKSLTIIKGKHSVNFYDISQFYPDTRKLPDAYQKNIGKLGQDYLDMKDKRSSFSFDYYRNHRKQIRDYCIQDCINTKKLAEHWIKLFHDAFRFYVSRWLSSGYLAEKILIKYGIEIPRLTDTPDQVNELATNATFGSRIELVRRGYIPEVYSYDIKSAYPFALLQIPQFTKGRWIQSRKLRKNALLGFFKLKCNIPRTKHITPFPFRTSRKLIFPSGEFITFVTLAELKACEDPTWYEILDSWQYVDDNPTYPYEEFVKFMYEKRLELKKANNPLELPFKIILNSIYGKTGQGERGNVRMGNLLNPIIFSTINGMCRAQIYKFIIDNNLERDVCMIYTDAITTTRNLNLESNKLGDFTRDKHGVAYLLQNGFYKIGDKFRNKGFANIGNDTIEHLEPFEEDGTIKYAFEMTKVGTLKENLARGTFDNIGKFSKVTRNLDLNADRGRFWLGRLTDVRKKETNPSAPFSFPEFDPDKI